MVAQSVLGITLLEGRESAADLAEAFRWLSAASERGASRAMWHLGTMYERGMHVQADPLAARSLYEAAASRGEFLASVHLARLLLSGQAGKAERAEVLRWYRAALDQASQVEDCPELEEARSYVAANSSAVGE